MKAGVDGDVLVVGGRLEVVVAWFDGGRRREAGGACGGFGAEAGWPRGEAAVVRWRSGCRRRGEGLLQRVSTEVGRRRGRTRRSWGLGFEVEEEVVWGLAGDEKREVRRVATLKTRKRGVGSLLAFVYYDVEVVGYL
ncbi:uncharacterized protein A4U43_C10F16920 [Asparagus officinalis]|uniref:Uncharacterized protein n=1 Tax=Asparagus officinalis TaxID=4686 RepID=A0A5P1E3K4_ASPOF|nr:uncharacterized protein A4U43_C10F16920 [Asparagus officinalis]